VGLLSEGYAWELHDKIIDKKPLFPLRALLFLCALGVRSLGHIIKNREL